MKYSIGAVQTVPGGPAPPGAPMYLGDGHDVGSIGWQVILALSADLLEGGHRRDGELGVAEGVQYKGQDAVDHDGVVSQPFRQSSWQKRGQGGPLRQATSL